MSSDLRVERDGALAHVIFARAQGLNILTTDLLQELKSTWSALQEENIRVAVLRAEGKAFLAGADIKAMSAFTVQQARDFAALGQSAFDAIESSPIVSIAAIHGACFGGGCELALACDIRMGASDLKIAQSEVNLGLIPGFGGTQRLPRVVGLGWALRIILSGQALQAQEALTAGLVTEIVPAEELRARADELARTLLTRGPHALRLAKRLVHGALDVKQATGLEAERYGFGNMFENGEAQEGTKAFAEKRPPTFK